MDRDRLRRALPWLASVVAALVAGYALGAWLYRAPPGPSGPDVETIADAALLSVREQGRLVSHSARFVAVVTASESRLGLRAGKTLILPGEARYGVDLSRLRRDDLAWDAATRTLTVTLPPLEVAGPTIDFDGVREFSQGGLILSLVGEASLDAENRRQAREELTRQARDPAVLAEAREAAMRIVARGFATPLRAAGIDASVAVRFVDSAGAEIAAYLDRPRRRDDVVEQRRAGVPATREEER